MKALFLDRDGVINEDFGYVYKKEDFKFKNAIFDLVQDFKEKGYKIFIVTNQSGIGRGYYSEKEFLELMEWVKQEFEKRGIEIVEVAYCPHHPDENCNCRKPKGGMILNLAKKYGINLKESVMIGDKESDKKASENAGVGRFYFENDIITSKKY